MKYKSFMRHCLSLASLGRGRVGNGALVGAVLVREGKVVAEGYHSDFGKYHAERELLEKFDQEIYPADTLFVNLEPCCHHGKTPPCTDVVLDRGIRRVVYGMLDPDPRVGGKGIALLEAKGVECIPSSLRMACEKLNRGFTSVRTKGRPWVTLKSARTTTGEIAKKDGKPLKITSLEQDEWSHTHLRAMSDAILVGVQTIINDNPRLDCRLNKGSNMNTTIDHYQPYRLVLDPHLRIPEDSRVLTDELQQKTILISCSHSGIDDRKRARIEAGGVRMLSVDMRDGMFDWDALWQALLTPRGDFHGLTSILVEGGRRTWDLFKRAGMMDEEVVLVGKGI